MPRDAESPLAGPAARLRDLGLSLPEPPQAIGRYEPWAVVGRTFVSSGQLPWRSGALACRGRIGRDLTIQEGYEACRIAALNALAHLHAAAGSLDRVGRILRIEGTLAVAADFTDHALVLDGASDLINAVFQQRGRHTRMVYGSPVLPSDAPCLVVLQAMLAGGADAAEG